MAQMANVVLLSLPMMVLSVSCLSTAVLARDPRWHGLADMMTANARAGESLIDTIYQFGDSISDTGNWIREDPSGLCSTFPYGEDYFHYATGRCSDGLIMVDFYAMVFELEFLHPYLEKDANFTNGVNFAVGGSTALDSAFLESKGVDLNGGTNSSLSVQLGWFKEYLNSTCSSTTDCKSKLARSLILMEDTGCDDLNYIATTGSSSSFQLAYELVPDIVQAVMNVVEEMILMGVVNVVVPSAFPIGCTPEHLVYSSSKDPAMYDDLGCLIDFNKLAEYQNNHLQKAVQKLQTTYPDTNLIYADYYSAIIGMLRNASSLGFDEDKLLVTCCGYGKNPYNFNTSTECGSLGVPVCPNPKKRVNWDGMHYTQHSYMYISNWMLKHTIIPQLGHASSS